MEALTEALEALSASEISPITAILAVASTILCAGWVLYKIVAAILVAMRRMAEELFHGTTRSASWLWREKWRILGGTALLAGGAIGCLVYAVGAGEALRLGERVWVVFESTSAGRGIGAGLGVLAGDVLFGLSGTGLLAVTAFAAFAGTEATARVQRWRNPERPTCKDWLRFLRREAARMLGAPLTRSDVYYWSSFYEHELAIRRVRETYFNWELRKAGHGPRQWSWWKQRLVGCEEYEKCRRSIEQKYQPPPGVPASALPFGFYRRMHRLYQNPPIYNTISYARGIQMEQQHIYSDARQHARKMGVDVGGEARSGGRNSGRAGRGKKKGRREGQQRRRRQRKGSGKSQNERGNQRAGSSRGSNQRNGRDNRRRRTKTPSRPPDKVMRALHHLKIDPEKVSPKTIKKAYREEAKRWHTDTQSGSKREIQMINDAKDVLTDYYDL